MITDKTELRSIIFKHLDGLATAPVAVALQKKRSSKLYSSKERSFSE